ncbi:MAG: hypothetical protein QF798_04005 [Candidatus Woesearchaeota archaeon]|nr:hypothetical protein [Candidatus Woesearchaeota archaeon]
MAKKIADELITQIREKYATGEYSKRQLAREIGISHGTVQVYLKYDSRAEYENHLVKRRGFENRTEYLTHLAKEKGFESTYEYQKHLAKEKGFENINEYQKHLAEKNGFSSINEYRKHLAEKAGTLEQFIIKNRLRRSLHSALIKYTKQGKIPSASRYGLNYEAIIESLKPFPENVKDYDLDHLIPLDFFDLEDNEEIKKAFNPSNLRWLIRKENQEKSNNLREQDLEEILKIPKELYPNSGIIQQIFEEVKAT